jgi:predicted nicotinamide N-methyase
LSVAGTAEQGGGPADVAVRETVVELDTLRLRLCRTGELDRYVDREALLRDEVPYEPPYWMHLWPGAMALARLVAQPGVVRTGARVLELGCGLGLPALVAATRGARVVASDWHLAPLGFLRRSAGLNRCRVDLVQMDWVAPALREPFDLCLGADVAYDAAAQPALVRAVRELVAADGTVYLADSVNTARQTLLERLRAEGFSVAVREVREWEDQRPVWVRVVEGRRR